MSKIFWSIIIVTLGFILINPSIVNAAPAAKTHRKSKPIETKPLLEKATAELNKVTSKGKPASNATTATGIFTVQEPELRLTSRSYQYLIGVKVQTLQPAGKVHSPFVGDFNLNSYDPQIFPVIEAGMSKDISSPSPWSSWNLIGQVGYSSVKVPLVFPSGYQAAEATKLNTMRASLGFEILRPSEGIPHLYFNLGTAIGKLFYTQTSFNDLAQFSESLTFGAFGLGANYDWKKTVDFSAAYVFRNALRNSDLNIQTHNFELGMKVRW